MRLERCILNMVESTADSSGRITLPSEAFNNIPEGPCRFIAVKKKQAEFVKLLPIDDPDAVPVEVYCEVATDQISTVIFALTKIAEKNKSVKFLQELEGICTGRDGKYPCTFDGFLLIKGDVDGAIKSIESELMNLSSGDIQVIKKLSIERL